MSLSDNQKNLLKILTSLLLVALAVTLVLWASSAFFMNLYRLPIEQSRPWTIVQYWLEYRKSTDKFLRLTVNATFLLPWAGFALLGFLIYKNAGKKALHGAARFATRDEVKEAGLIDPPKGLDKTILVGKYKDNYLTYGGFQFVLLAAPTRSGKGVGVVVPNCLNYSDSLVVLDIKGENFDITSGFRKACGQEVYLFSPYAQDGRTHRYNPLDYVSDDPAERLGDIDAIGQALYSGENNNDKFWSENAKDFFRGVSLFVLENPDLPHTLGEILRQASGKGKPVKDHLLGKLKEAQDAGRPYSNNCVDALNRVLNNSENTLAGIVATFNTALLSFQNPKVDLATSASDFDLREVRRRKMSIYFKIEPTKLKDARVLINLFFDQLLNLNTRVLPTQDETLKNQCLVLLDEMTSIGTVNMIKQAVSYMAGYNMRLLTIIQNKSQLEDVYGKAGAITLLSNHALMIMYAPSPTTQSDAQEYSEMLGYQTVKSKSVSHGRGSDSTSESDQRRALLLPQEIRELGGDNEIVTLENTKPILCKKIRYWQDKEFKKRANWAVPDIPFQDVKLYVAKLEQRIRTLRPGEINQKEIEDSVVTAEFDTSETERLEDWTEEQLTSYVETYVYEEVANKSLKFSAAKNITASVVSSKTESLEEFNKIAGTTDGTNSNEASSESVDYGSLEEEGDAENEELNDALEAYSQDKKAAEVKTEEESDEETDDDVGQDTTEDRTIPVVSEERVETDEEVTEKSFITINVDATDDDWNEEQLNQFVDSLITQIRKELIVTEKPLKPEQATPVSQPTDLPKEATVANKFHNKKQFQEAFKKARRKNAAAARFSVH